jgi:hypothetical protein
MFGIVWGVVPVQVRGNAALAVATLAHQCDEMIHPFAMIR